MIDCNTPQESHWDVQISYRIKVKVPHKSFAIFHSITIALADWANEPKGSRMELSAVIKFNDTNISSASPPQITKARHVTVGCPVLPVSINFWLLLRLSRAIGHNNHSVVYYLITMTRVVRIVYALAVRVIAMHGLFSGQEATEWINKWLNWRCSFAKYSLRCE